MKHLRMPRLLRFVTTLAVVVCSLVINAQTFNPKSVSTTANSGGFYEYLPAGYSSSSQSYPLIVFIHGIGELGSGSSTDLSKLLNCWNALPRLIKNGQFPSSFNVGGQSHSFIVIAPQFKNWPSASDVNDVINYVTRSYRVNTSRIYVTGLSMGGGTTFEFAAAYPSRVAAIVPTCGASWPDATRAQSIANGKVAVWGTHNDYDGTVSSSNTKGYVDQIVQKGGIAKKTIWPVSGHDSWTKTYDPNFKENNMNVYEWMLQYQKGSAPAPAPAPAPEPTGSTVSLPGKVEAENYTAMSGIQTENTSDAGGGKDVGWIDNGDWMEYSVNATVSGSYTVKFRVATPNSGAQLQLKNSSGTVLATVYVPNTGGFQSWQTVTATVNLPAGTQKLKVQSTGSGWNFNYMEFAASITSSPIPAPTGTTVSLPGKVEAENYTAMNGIQTENTSDADGGKNVGWIDNGDWMDYSVNASVSGSYTVKFRVATPNSGAQLQLKNSSGSVLATVNIPNTWGFQSWQTVTATVNLPAGTQTLRVQSTGSGWNFNYMEFASGSITTSPTSPTTSSRIEAENYSSMSGVQTDETTDAGGGKYVGWIDNGDWMNYNVSVSTSGTYTINLRVATIYSGSQLQIKKADGSWLATVNVPTTGGFQTFQTISANIALAAGSQTIKIQSTSSAGWNINWLEVAGGNSTSTSPTTSSRIEAEKFSSMSGVQTSTTTDAGGGEYVGWIDNGDWMNYNVSVSTSGTYTINLRIATIYSGSQLQIKKADGSWLATVNIPITGGFQTFQTISANVALAAGSQTIKIQSTSSAGWNINWLEIGTSSSLSLAKTSTGIMSTETTNTTTAPALEVFPNPVTDRFALQVNNELTGALQVQVINLQGVVQKQFSLSKTATGSSQFYLSIGELPAANYIIRANMTNWNQSVQIVKQ